MERRKGGQIKTGMHSGSITEELLPQKAERKRNLISTALLPS